MGEREQRERAEEEEEEEEEHSFGYFFNLGSFVARRRPKASGQEIKKLTHFFLASFSTPTSSSSIL